VSPRLEVDRRRFLVLAGASGLVLGGPGTLLDGRAAETGPAIFNPFLSIDREGTVTLFCGRSEMGQGVFTGLGQLVAEELDCDWQKLRVETGPADDAFVNIYGGEELLTGGHSEPDQLSDMANWWYTKIARNISQQFTGGSSSARDGFVRLRQVGAAARAMLVQAAGLEWGVPAAECVVVSGVVSHPRTGRRRSYGDLAAAAARLDPPDEVTLKPRGEWRVIGQKVPRLDIPAKIDGTAVFGIDVRRPNMLFASVANCPVFGGKLKRFDAAAALGLPGVERVQAVPGGVAVVADTTWHALAGVKALAVEWDPGPNPKLDSAALQQQYRAALDGPLDSVATIGDVDKALKSAAKLVTAVYSLPFLAHAAMEPLNCTAEVTKDGVDVWVSTQAQTAVQKAAADTANVSTAKVRIHTTLLGGGFGRRGEVDIVIQAVTLAKATALPVQVVWSREEDMQHDFYRPMAVSRLDAGLDAMGMPIAWRHRVATSSIFARLFPPLLWLTRDPAISEGSTEMPYAIPNQAMASSTRDSLVPVGAWRSVGHSVNGFFKECFLDEVAAAGGIDPVELRRRLLAGRPRELAVLERVAQEADWGKPLAPGRGRGVALHSSFGSIVAQIAEVTVDDGKIRVDRVVAAVDCGTVISPDIVEAQIQGAIVYGMTAALYGKITIEGGRVVQANFPDYDMLRLQQAPEIVVHIIASTAYPGGIGEPGLPPIAPAIANAVFAATGKRVRSLPLVDMGFTV
jgi:isoquinoline 1-oxidoreductase beta subunit